MRSLILVLLALVLIAPAASASDLESMDARITEIQQQMRQTLEQENLSKVDEATVFAKIANLVGQYESTAIQQTDIVQLSSNAGFEAESLRPIQDALFETFDTQIRSRMDELSISAGTQESLESLYQEWMSLTEQMLTQRAATPRLRR